MKRKFTVLSAALVLLAFLAHPMGMWADEAQYVFNTDAGIAALGISKPSSGAGTSLSTTTPYTVGQISMSVTHGSTDTRVWNSSGTLDLRIYKSGGSLTFAAASGYNITGITIAGSAVGNFSVNNGTYSSGSWSNGTTGASSVTFTATNTGKINTITVTYSASGSTLQASDLALVNAPVELEFDLYDNASAQTISYTTSSTGAVTVSQSDYITATVNANNTITVTPVAVTNGPQTITVNQAADDTYDAGSVTFTVDIEDSTPSTGSDVTFDATVDKDLNNTTQGEGSIVKNGVTFTCSDGILGNGTEYRLYKNSTTTFSVESGTITQIVFTCTSGNPASGFATQTGWTTNGSNGTWTGNATSVSFVASSKQVRATQIVVTVETSGTPDPTISADNVDIAYSATSGSITYTINNEPSPAGTLTATVTEGNWLTLGQGTTSPIAFTCTANENTTARTATVTLTYTYNTDQTVSANVTVTQAAAPVSYTTIPALFNAATTTETSVYVTFNNWVVSGVSTNGKSVFVTDNDGNGFVIYYTTDMSSTFAAGNILSGTAVSCTLKKYNGFAELLNVTATDLTITSGGTVTVADVALADLAGVNTGALLHYDNLTCSVDNNKYYLSDGTTTLQVYNSLFTFDALEDGKTYNITGIYQQYNSTKEILPRSATDIEVVEVQHEEYTLTIGEMSHVSEIFLFDSDNESESIEITNNAATITDGTTVMVSFTIESGYVFESINVTYGDNQTVETTEIEPGEYYSFEMPAANATLAISATEYVAPSGDQYELYSGALVEGDYLIVYDGGAMNTTVTSDRLQYEAVTATNNVITTDNAAIVWHIAPSGQYWTIYNANADAYAASTGAKNKAQMLSDGTDDKALWTVSGTETYEFVNKQNTANNVNANLRKNGTFGFACYATSTGGALSLYKKVEDTPTGYPLTIVGVGEENWDEGKAGYYLIASPVTVDPSTVGMTTGEFDLYYFDQAEDDEWQNWKDNDETGHFNLVPGKGYLYAHKTGGQFTLTGTPYTGNGQIRLTKTDDASVDFQGWNLVGNPFGELAYLPERDYYIMKADGSEIIAPTNPSYSVEAMQGVFVIAEEDGETITFTTTRPANNGKSIALNLSNGSNVIDRTIIRFGQGRQLPKFQLNKNHTKVYIPQDGQDYAVVRSEEMGEMPVNFKAENNGSYTLNLSSENVEFAYLHLIDNLTGANIDMLQTPSYSFDAKTTDYENRFKLVFATGSSTGSDAFAFYSNGSFVINNDGNATLQVVDVTGRIINSESINGCANVNVNAAPGVYMLRLVNGDNVKVQKVVVK